MRPGRYECRYNRYDRVNLTARLVLVAVLSAAGACWPAHGGAEETRVVVKVGGEHDTNPRRLVGDVDTTDQVVRVFVKADIERELDAVGELGLKILAGAKAHAEVGDEDALVTSLRARWQRELARGELGWLGVWVRGDIGDRTERTSTRDYLRGGVVAGFRYAVARAVMSLGAGYRAFIYKPDLSSNHRGATAEAVLGVRIGWGLTASASYVFIEREFDVARLIEVEDGLVALDDDQLREDALHAARFGVSYQGPLLASLSYGVQVNDSNSFGPGLVRHIGEATWTQPLWLGMRLVVSGRIQRTLYDDPVRIDETLTVDDEDRNQLVAALNIPLPPVETASLMEEILGLELRYSLYTEAIGEEREDFIRHLFYVGLSAELDPLLADE